MGETRRILPAKAKPQTAGPASAPNALLLPTHTQQSCEVGSTVPFYKERNPRSVPPAAELEPKADAMSTVCVSSGHWGRVSESWWGAVSPLGSLR